MIRCPATFSAGCCAVEWRGVLVVVLCWLSCCRVEGCTCCCAVEWRGVLVVVL